MEDTEQKKQLIIGFPLYWIQERVISSVAQCDMNFLEKTSNSDFVGPLNILVIPSCHNTRYRLFLMERISYLKSHCQNIFIITHYPIPFFVVYSIEVKLDCKVFVYWIV